MNERELTYHAWTTPEELERAVRGLVEEQRFRYLAADRIQRILPSVGAYYDTPWFTAYRDWAVNGGPPVDSLDLQDDFVPFDHHTFDSPGSYFFSCEFGIRSNRPLLIAASAAEGEARLYAHWVEPPLDAAHKHRSRSAAKQAPRLTEVQQSRLDWLASKYAHKKAVYAEFREQFRCVSGDPFRPVVMHPEWLTTTAVGIAAAIDERQAFDSLPILADALEDAGCSHSALLEHARGPNVHIRGCWVVDMLLGRQVFLQSPSASEAGIVGDGTS